MEKKKSFILFHSFGKMFRALSDEEAGTLIKAIFRYEESGEESELEGMSAMAFIAIQDTLDRNREEYSEVCRKRSESARKRWDKISSLNANASVSIQSDTINTDNVNDDVNENENATDIVSVSVRDNENACDTVCVSESPRGNDNRKAAVSYGGSELTDTQNNKEENKLYGRFVRLTEWQYAFLCDRHGEDAVQDCINRVDCYLTKSGQKPYSNHYTTISEWLSQDSVSPKRRSFQPTGGDSPRHSVDVDALIQHAMTHIPKI